jgi:GNAT superfamily N-acetyltransferase
MDAVVRVRRAGGADIGRLLPLCAEHAAFERLPHALDHAAADLAAALDDTPAPLHAWLAECGDKPVGYATASVDFSTLAAAHYLHLDCLFVREGWRNRAIGRQLWQALHDFALALDCRQMQWQTPEWNTGAARFYLRLGACELRKRRYVLALDATMPPPPRR